MSQLIGMIFFIKRFAKHITFWFDVLERVCGVVYSYHINDNAVSSSSALQVLLLIILVCLAFASSGSNNADLL